MRRSGLQNRFDREELNATWTFFHRCLWCDKSGFDSFHHIKSPSSQDYRNGEFNESMLNSCPIHNFGCHLYNGQLHHLSVEKRLLRKVADALVKEGYKLKQKDNDFLNVYAMNYVE